MNEDYDSAAGTQSIGQLTFPYGITAYYRPGASDERVLREVITKATYRRSSIGFDVRQGETWLDLGANIGAFALYCKLNHATAVCYEPDPDCFALLTLNVPEFERHNVPLPRGTTSRSRSGRDNRQTTTTAPPRYPAPSCHDIPAASFGISMRSVCVT
jgi:hypothetical protein